MARVEVYSGICGFTTRITATSEDRQHVTLEIPRVGHMGMVLAMGREDDAVTPALMTALRPWLAS